MTYRPFRSYLVPSLLAMWLLTLVGSCSDRPDTDDVTASLSGAVYVAGPVQGAVVSAFLLDMTTGQRGELIAKSEPTDAEGAFVIDMGTYSGPVVLEARGAGAGYTEPASGAEATFEAATRLRAILVDWDTPGESLRTGFEFGEHRDGVLIGPWSELAMTYADARLRAGLSSDFARAAEDSILTWFDHLELDYWRVTPLPLTDGAVGPTNERVQAGVLYAGLSMHARRIAVASSLSPAAVSSLSVLESLKLDLGDSVAQLDGLQTGSSAPITLGACPPLAPADAPTICELSGQTLRSRFNEAVGLFLLDEAVNKSGLVYNDVSQLMGDIACRTSALFPAQPCRPDSLAPVITFEGVQENDPAMGDLAFAIRVRDEQKMGEVLPLSLSRGSDEGQGLSPLSVVRDTADPAAHALDVLLDSTAVSDGPLQITVTAEDSAGNRRTASISVNVDNTGKGSIFGNVMIGGRCDGCEVVAIDMTDGLEGAVLGTATTMPDGDYDMEIAESPLTTSLLVVARKPLGAEATYREMTNDAVITLSAEDQLEAVIVDYVDGETGRVVNINPFTHTATALARGRYASGAGVEPDWADAVVTAYAAFNEHFADGGPTIDIRERRPADVTAEVEVGTLTAQVRMGLLIAALGEVANDHATASAQGPTTMNTLTLTEVLADDLSFDSAEDHAGCAAEPCGPVLNGRSGSALSHGVVVADSFWTRSDLAVGLVHFLESNPADATTFTEVDMQMLLETISVDENPGLYDQPGLPYDTIPPCTAPAVCAFQPPTPAEGAVLRGPISLRVTAQDNRALLRTPTDDAGLSFTAPAPVVSDPPIVPVNPEDPWLRLGALDTDLLPEGPNDIEVTITDEALSSVMIARQIIVDRTPPDITGIVAETTVGGDVVPAGGITGAEELTISGAVADTYGVASMTYTLNGGPPIPLGFAGGAWSFDVALVNGTNTLALTATDHAGNVRSGVTLTYMRDATPPVLERVTDLDAVGKIQNEATYEVSIGGAGLGPVIYSPTATTDDLVMSPGMTFSKYPTRYYDAAQPNLPEWRYLVSDNTTTDDDILFELRILRGTTTLVDWTSASAGSAIGYNRSVRISGELHTDLANVDGTYTLEVRATDYFGNTSAVDTATWTQTILPVPMTWETGNLGTGESDPTKLPRYYTLEDTGNSTGWPANNFSGLLQTSGLRVAEWTIRNPHPIPVRVNVPKPYVVAEYWSGRILREVVEDIASMSSGPCHTTRQQLTTPLCWPPFIVLIGSPTVTTEGMKHGILTDLATGVQFVGGGSVVAPCADCASTERIIGPGQTYTVYATTGAFTFADTVSTSSYQDIGAIGAPATTNITGIPNYELTSPDMFYRKCDDTKLVAGMIVCDEATKRQAVRSFTRFRMDFSVASATLQARVASEGALQTAATTAPGLAGDTRNLLEIEPDCDEVVGADCTDF